MRFDRFASKALRLLTAAAAAGVLSVTAAPAPAGAVGSAVQSAPEFNGSVYAIAYRGTTVYVGGAFTSVISGGRAYDRQRLAAFDTRTGQLTGWAPAADGSVRALAISGTSVYAAGDFHRVSGLRRDAVVQVDGSSGAVAAFVHSVSGTPYALAAGNGRLYLGGRFADVDGLRRGNLAAFSLVTGAVDSAWRPVADDAVHAVRPYGSTIYLGGAFHTVDRIAGTARLAAVSASGGTVDRAFRPDVAAEVNAVAADAAGVYVATGGQGGRALAYTGRGTLRWQRVFDGDTAAIVTLGGVTYVGGHFDRACLTASNGLHGACTAGSVPRVKLAAVLADGTLSTWAPAANGVVGVRALAVDPAGGTISAGGDFTQVDGQIRRRFATFG